MSIILKRSPIKLKYSKLNIIRYFQDAACEKLRNIGILAHIDAGKTTTTERMLYYAGKISSMGEVHHGNTVTDYMAQERERGITIRSAAVTFNWKGSQINLVDTPGHIDFTIEVEETLSVLDGAVVVLDGSAGVEAQTLTVWKQADGYGIPRIVFVNKMDRNDSDVNLCCSSIEKKFGKPTLLLQVPIRNEGKLEGLVDSLTVEKLWWTDNKIFRMALTEQNDASLWNIAMTARRKLIDRLTDYNDNFANLVIESNSLDEIKTTEIESALRSVTLDQTAIPVLCGSAYKNIGVEPLLDAIALYLPSPNERNLHFKCFGDRLSARAFKILHDRQRGTLVFFRIYSGELKKGQKLYNISQDCSEQTTRLYISYADEYQEVDSISTGNIAVAVGLKKTILGDLVSQTAASANSAKQEMQKRTADKVLIEKVFGTGARVPDPVFFCSIEPPSLAYQTTLEQALSELQREDPSLKVTHDPETGQTVLAGMGELHLEIIKDRIWKEYKVKADLGPLQIAYHEAPLSIVSREHITDMVVGTSKHYVKISFTLIPTVSGRMTDVIKLDKTHDAASNLSKMLPKQFSAIKQGVEVALSHGPKISCKVVNVEIILHHFEVSHGTAESIISASTTQAIQKLLEESGTRVLEPYMNLEIVLPEDKVTVVLADLTRRRSNILNISVRGQNKIITCETPLSELIGYSTSLRTITSGTATVTIEFLEYRMMSDILESAAIASVRGF